MFTMNLSPSALLLAAFVALVASQPPGIKFPPLPGGLRGFPNIPPNFPPIGGSQAAQAAAPVPGAGPLAGILPPTGGFPPVPPGFPPRPMGGIFMGMFTQHCQLSYPKPFRDESIVEKTQNTPAFPFAAAQLALFRDSAARGFMDGVRRQDAARNAARDAGRGAGVSEGRSKRQAAGAVGAMEQAFLTPTGKKPLCQTIEKEVTCVINNGDLCYSYPGQDNKYWECLSKDADMSISDPTVQRYYCHPDNYAYHTLLVYCPGTAENVRWHTVSISLNCCCKRHSCDFTPYASMNGPQLYPQ